MFGISISESLILDMYRVEVTNIGNGIVYRRYKNDAIEKEIFTKDISLKPIPIYPLFYPRFLTRYILCEFNTPIYVPPMDSINFYMFFPIDIAIYGYKDNYFTVLDIIPIHRLYKYTLYGPPSRYGDVGGVIARYFKVATSLEKPKELMQGFCISYIEVRNKLDRFTAISKILLDSSPLLIFYETGSWRCCTQHITVTINTSTIAVVEYDRKPIEQGFKSIDEPEEVKTPIIIFRNDMLWGY